MLVRKSYWISFLLALLVPYTSSQDQPTIIIRPTPQQAIVLAVPDVTFQDQEQNTGLSDMLRTLNQVLWDDLRFAGYFTLAGKSFYPPQTSTGLQYPDYEAWNTLSLNVSYLSSGTTNLVDGVLHVNFRVFDLKVRSYAFGLELSGDRQSVRALAHRWADELVYNLTAGASRGIARTKITYVSRNGKAKDINVMDYDGHNSQLFIRNGSLNLFPAWSPDNSKIAFATDKSGQWELNIRSFIDGSQLSFPTFNSHISTPSFSPDGKHLAYALRSVRNDSDIFISQLNGSERINITNNPAIDYSPTWSPSGRQLAFTSDRDNGSPQIYICDADGTNVRRLVNEGGEADSPSWSPDAQWIAFHWKPRGTEKFDIYIGEVSTGRILQLTSAAGNNLNPSWAPDSRHIVFESDRSGTSQIYLMQLSDPSNIRKITDQGENSTPAWGRYSDN